MGVVFLTVPPPEDFPLLSLIWWINKRVPVIQQIGHWAKDGFVIWTLFHEIGHVLNGPRTEMHPEYKKKRTSEAEKRATAFAMCILFGPEGMAPFKNLSSDRDIAAQARRVGIAPGVAVYQMHQRRMLGCNQGNSLFVDLSGTWNGEPVG